LLSACHGNPFTINSNTFSSATNPILCNIGTSFERFRNAFTGIGKNYLKSYILKNPKIRCSNDDKGLLCKGFFGQTKTVQIFGIIGANKGRGFACPG